MLLTAAQKIYKNSMTTAELKSEVCPFLYIYEVICPCGCGRWDLTDNIKKIWTGIREDFGHPITVNSGIRCEVYNATINDSSSNSNHIIGDALDFKYPYNYNRKKFIALALRNVTLVSGGLGVYQWGIHVDGGIGKKPDRRWDYSIKMFFEENIEDDEEEI